MKFILLAAAAIVATPALAQTTTPMQPADQTAPATPVDQAPPAATQSDQAAPAPAPTDSTMQNTTPSTTVQASPQPMPMASAPSDGTDPVGGYAPTTPAVSGAVAPGATVTFRPAPTPDQAYPAPAPMASYPICKAGQFDNCMQRSDARPARRRR